MRCHEARIQIEAGDLDSVALLEHLRQCTSCAQLANAERRLMQSLQHVAQSAQHPSTPLLLLRQRIEEAAVGASQKERNLMSRISNQVRIHPRLSVSMAAAVLVFLFTTLVPFSYERVIGYDATVAFAGVIEGIPQEKIEQALVSIGQNDVKVSVEQDNEQVKYRLSGFASESQAMQVVLAMNLAAGTRSESEIKPVSKKFSSSLIKQAVDAVITIKLSESKSKTDQELEHEIVAKMQQAGLLSPRVKVTRDSDSSRVANAEAYFPNATAGDSSEINIMWQLDRGGEIGLQLFSIDSTYAFKAITKPGGNDSLRGGGNRKSVLKLQAVPKEATDKTGSTGTSK